MSSSKGSGNQEPRPQGILGLETPRQGTLRAILLPSVHPLAPHPPSLFLLVQPLLVIVGLTPWMTHPGVGFLVPAMSPSLATWSSSGPADLAPHHLGRQPRAPQLRGGPRPPRTTSSGKSCLVAPDDLPRSSQQHLSFHSSLRSSLSGKGSRKVLEWSCGHKYARSLEEGTSNTP